MLDNGIAYPKALAQWPQWLAIDCHCQWRFELHAVCWTAGSREDTTDNMTNQVLLNAAKAQAQLSIVHLHLTQGSLKLFTVPIHSKFQQVLPVLPEVGILSVRWILGRPDEKCGLLLHKVYYL